MTLKQQRDAAIIRQQCIVNAAKQDGSRELTAAEQAEYETLQREIDRLTLEITAQERRQEATGNGIPTGETEPQSPGREENPKAVEKRGVEDERRRVTEIMELCRDFDIDPEEHIMSGAEISEVRDIVLEKLRVDNSPVSVKVEKDEGDKFRECASDALMMRAGMEVEKPSDGAKELRAMSLRDFAIECRSREGENAIVLMRTPPDQLYDQLCRQFYNPTAAFPAILDNTIQKSIIQLYSKVPTTFQAWTGKGSLKDFKETADHEYIIGGTGDFLKVPENGELKADTPKTELLPSRKLDTYGRSFSMTRQAFINDDIGFLTEVPGLYATSAKKTIDKAVYTILYRNGKIFDNVPLFDAKHGNLIGKGEKPSQASIQSIILQMQKQKDPFGDAIYITPQFIIVPVGYEFDLAVILHSAQITGSSNNDINPLYNYPIEVIQTPVLNVLAGENAAPWFMAANWMSAKSIQVDYLNGQEMPTVRRMEKPGVLGLHWDIFLDWGIAVRDFRGIAKNPGEAIK